MKCAYCHNVDSQSIFSKTQITPDEVVNMAKRYKSYYNRTGGGVIFSGGEPLMQGEFLLETIKKLKEDEYKYNGEALEDTVISTLTKVKFDEIAIKIPTVTLKILEKAYERIRHAEDLVDRLSSTDANSKVARLLLKLIQGFGTKDGNSIV